jgi:hypothetical protein
MYPAMIARILATLLPKGKKVVANIVNILIAAALSVVAASAPGTPRQSSAKAWSADPPCYDFNEDELVDVADMQLIAIHWRLRNTDPGWDARFDPDGDGGVDIVDIMRAAESWGTSCGELTDGGTFTGVDGVKIGAVVGALDAPLPVAIVPDNPPADPLPSPSTRLGNYYRISAQREAVQPLDKSFILALPVPQGADNTRLAIAVYTANARLLDAGNLSGHHWELVPGVYDAANGLLLAQFLYLSQEGETVTLVQHPDMVTLQKGAGSRLAPSNIKVVGQFVAACHNLACELAIKSQVENELEINRIEFSAHFSYPFPRLQGTQSDMSVDPPQINQPSAYYFVFIYPNTEPACTDRGGAYNPATGALWLCRADGLGGLSDYEKQVVRHEYFHALQYAYNPVLADWEAGERESWITEGMANAVVNSDVDWHRSGINAIRPIDMSLRDDSDVLEYQAEDFWVYLGRQRLGGGVEQLQHTLVFGADLDAVIGDFGLVEFWNAYWDWVRNQVFEKRDDMDGALGAPCELLEAAAPHLLKIEPTPTIIGNTTPLNAFMVELLFPDLPAGEQVDIHVDPRTGSQFPDGFNYKLYLMPGAGCVHREDNTIWRIQYDPNTRYFVLLANATEDNVDWVISVVLF